MKGYAPCSTFLGGYATRFNYSLHAKIHIEQIPQGLTINSAHTYSQNTKKFVDIGPMEASIEYDTSKINPTEELPHMWF